MLPLEQVAAPPILMPLRTERAALISAHALSAPATCSPRHTPRLDAPAPSLEKCAQNSTAEIRVDHSNVPDGGLLRPVFA
jgi:hypothetical protein